MPRSSNWFLSIMCFLQNPVNTYPLPVRATCTVRIIRLDNYSLIRALSVFINNWLYLYNIYIFSFESKFKACRECLRRANVCSKGARLPAEY
jgi:hypothetical protein